MDDYGRKVLRNTNAAMMLQSLVMEPFDVPIHSASPNKFSYPKPNKDRVSNPVKKAKRKAQGKARAKSRKNKIR